MTEDLGPYVGGISPRFDTGDMRDQLSRFGDWLAGVSVTALSEGSDQVVKTDLVLGNAFLTTAIKVFSRQSPWKDWYDQKHGSKAERAFRYADFLFSRGLGTAQPIAWLDRWDRGRLLESYFLCLHVEADNFRDALAKIYRDQRDNEPMMALLYQVAPAIGRLHEAGFMHGDLGNQNILVPQSEAGDQLQPLFIDLNRARQFKGPLGPRQRAHDLARIALPGKYLEIFKAIYNDDSALPEPLASLEKKARKRFWAHRRSSRWRHPIRHYRQRLLGGSKIGYPSEKDLWLWDDKTSQPMVTLNRAEKRRNYHLADVARTLGQTLAGAPALWSHYRRLLAKSYARPVSMKNRFGIALHPNSAYLEQEWALLGSLGYPPTLVRFCHHESKEAWQEGIALVNRLHQAGVDVTVAILQDRQAVLNPASWKVFLDTVISAVGDKANQIEVTHARNRSKWGIWTSQEFTALLQPLVKLQAQYPNLRLIGPACIDFEYLPVITALADLPAQLKFSGLSHLLYVDRRGAPENKQGQFSTLEKTAFLRAIAEWSDRTENRVVISEVNWPIKGSGVWSPVACPYETEIQRKHPMGETEADYADYMLRFLALTVCSGHVDQVFWWRLSAHGYGLVDDQEGFRRRPAFYALKFILALLGDATFIEKHESEQDQYLLEFMKDDKRILMIWQTVGEQPVSGLGAIEAGWDAYGEPMLTPVSRPSPTYYQLSN
ncbi:MAG: lipopolysaccharide kinase InaA family protein [Pseudomonadales bacterium]